MAILNEFELKVVNKEIKDLSYEEVIKIFGDCLFLNVEHNLEKLADIVRAISYIPNDLDKEVAWESAKYTFKDVFAKATICVAPRFHICEMPYEKSGELDRHCVPFYKEEEQSQEAEVGEKEEEPTPAKRKPTKK